MYHKVRITVVSLVVVAICMLSSTGTLSYFTDTDSATNNFVIGNASTELKIYDDVTSGNEHEFVTNDYVLMDDYVYKSDAVQVGAELSAIPFYLQATNDGNIPVYQRFRVVIPIALADVMTVELPCTLGTPTDGVSMCSTTEYTVKYDASVEVENTPTYAEYYIVSNSVLGVNSTTSASAWPTTAIKIGTISGVENLDSITECANNDANRCAFGIKAYSDAIQATGLSAVQAFDNFTETY